MAENVEAVNLAVEGTSAVETQGEQPSSDNAISMYDTWATREETEPRPLAGARAEFAEKVLDREVLVEISDQRLLLGRMECTDAAKNLVLSRVQEYRLGNDFEGCAAKETLSHRGQSYACVRLLGVASVPGEHIKGFYISKN